MADGKKQIYWLTSEIQDYQTECSVRLERIGYDAVFFTSVAELRVALRQKRVLMLILSDVGDQPEVEKMLSELMKIPDVLGARLILDSHNGYKSLKKLAIESGFRDVIPSCTNDEDWVERFEFATSSAKVSEPPTMMLNVNIKSVASIPSKITHFSAGKLRVETKLDAPVGSRLVLEGKLLESLGVEKLKVKIIDKEVRNLSYRFSHALNMSFEMSDVDENLFSLMLDKMEKGNSDHKKRAFVVCSHQESRDGVFRQLPSASFEVRSAITLNAMVSEPKYFTPDIIVIESSYLSNQNVQVFSDMCRSLQPETRLIIIGKTSHIDYFKSKFKDLMFYNIIKQNIPVLSELISSFGIEVKSERFQDMTPVPFNHMYSSANFMIPAKVTKIHTKMGEVRFPVPVGEYGLVSLSSSSVFSNVLNNPFIKLSNYTRPSPKKKVRNNKKAIDYQHCFVFYFSDLANEDRVKLNSWMLERFSEELKLYVDESAIEAKREEQNSQPIIAKNAKNLKKTKEGQLGVSKAYEEHMRKVAARRDVSEKPASVKPRKTKKKKKRTKKPKFVEVGGLKVPYKQFHLVKTAVIVMLVAGVFALFIGFVAKPNLSKIGVKYSTQFMHLKNYYQDKTNSKREPAP